MITKIKPLIFIPSPRNLSEFYDATTLLKYDKLWVKYFTQHEAYQVGRLWFLEHKEYTHLIILPDDLIIKNEDIERLLESETLIISGWCIHGKSPQHRKGLDSNIAIELPLTDPNSTFYSQFNWLQLSDIVELGDVVMPVGFSGFAPTVIPRNIVEKIEFRTSNGCCVDTCFSQDLFTKGIMQFADLKVKTREIEATDPNLLLVGKAEREVVLETV